MNLTWLRAQCLALPHTTEQIQWGDHLLFKIGGKMYAATSVDEAKAGMSFKCSPEEFAELIEMPGIIPAPYLARAHWVALETEDALPRTELKKRLTRSYELVRSGLTKKAQAELEKSVSIKSKTKKKGA
ncbi:MAG: MmcQ/YjbR family DNA-binding protein [Acidobacteriota bacterium]